MKLGNIFLLTVIILGGLVSCSSEEPIDGTEGSTTIPLVITLGDNISSKAAAEGYTYATEEELTINNCHVAVFAVDENGTDLGKCIFSKDYSLNTMSSTEERSGKKEYKLTLNDVRTFGRGVKKIKIMVVANVQGLGDQAGFSGYQSLVIKEQLESSSLVKVGLSDLVYIEYGESTNEVDIALTQLSARLDFKEVIVQAGTSEKKYFNVTKVDYSGVNLTSDLAIFSNTKLENKQTNYTGTGSSSTGEAFSFYSYEGTGHLNLKISGYFTDQKESEEPDPEIKTYMLDLSQNEFIKGNCYEITGYVKENKLEWNIVKIKWNDVPVDVNYGK